jgi:pilus assembly protein CpaF
MSNDTIRPIAGKLKYVELNEALRQTQDHMVKHYSTLLDTAGTDQAGQVKIYIRQFLNTEKLGVEGLTVDELTERLYTEMAEFSLLSGYLQDRNIEEININSWRDIKVTYTDGRIVPSEETFRSPTHAVDVIRRLLHKSNMIIDQAQPIIRGHLNGNTRITAYIYPVVDKDVGVVASIRIVNPKNLQKKDFVDNGTATEEMLDFLASVFRYGVSACVAGATGSGKTTLMAWIMQQIPDDKRVFTIENGTREFNLVRRDREGNTINNVIHTVTKNSDNEKMNIDQETLLEYALTTNPDVICVGEMKSSEAFAAQEAARTGHAVITTTHANSCEATYNRMVTLCRTKYAIDDKVLYQLVTEAFPIVIFTKRLEDNSRKIMEITEMEIDADGNRKLRTLYRYKVTGSQTMFNQYEGKAFEQITGEFEKVNEISSSLKKRLIENGMPIEGGVIC